MNSDERSALLCDLMRDLAPEITKYVLAYGTPEEIHYAPERIVNLTAQIASGLLTRFVELTDATAPQSPSTKIAFAPSLKSPANPAAKIQRSSP